MGNGGMNVLALCAGIGGLELGLQLASGGDAAAVCYVEREARAASLLVSRMAAGQLAQAPIWSDVATFDGGPWRGRVDCITAGFPCQPFSVAGRQRGLDDARWLWPRIDAIVGDVEPDIVFLENVPGLRKHGLAHVLRDLAARGYDAEWSVLRAADVGAPHQRRRIFILAYRSRERLARLCPWHDDDGSHAQRDVADRCASELVDANDERGDRPLSERLTEAPGPGRRVLADTARSEEREPAKRREQDPSVGGETVPGHVGEPLGNSSRPQHFVEGGFRGGLPNLGDPDGAGLERVWPPGPATDPNRWPKAEPKPSFRGKAHGFPRRVDRLRVLGNGVVPLAAAHAFRSLVRRALRN